MDILDKRFILTGGAGFIGSYLADLLLEEGAAEVVAFDTMHRGSYDNIQKAMCDPRFRFERADIRHGYEIENLFEGMDGCFHLAALRITECAAKPMACHDVMLTGTMNTLNACLKHNIKRVVFSSSASIYGLADEFPTNEMHHPYNDRTLYGVCKTWAEGTLRVFHNTYGLKSTSLRYFNVYGPRMDIYGKYTEVLIRWMDCFVAGVQPKIFGDGKQTMDFVHVTDVARANICAMKANCTEESYNVAAGAEVSLLDLLYCLAKAWGVESLKPEFLPSRSVNPVPRRLASTEKSLGNIGFSASISLEEGLKDLVDWYRAAKRITP